MLSSPPLQLEIKSAVTGDPREQADLDAVKEGENDEVFCQKLRGHGQTTDHASNDEGEIVGDDDDNRDSDPNRNCLSRLITRPQLSTPKPTQNPRRRRPTRSKMSLVSFAVLLVVAALFSSRHQNQSFHPRGGRQSRHNESQYQYKFRQRRRNLGQKFNRAIKSKNFADYSCEDMHQLREHYYGESDMKIIVDNNSESDSIMNSSNSEKEGVNVSYLQQPEQQQHEEPLSPYLYYSVAQFECDFSQTCNDGEGIFLPMVFCSSIDAVGASEPQVHNDGGSTAGEGLGGSSYFQSKQFLLWSTSIPLILLLLVLFRVLGSTGEEFFSPALELYRYANDGTF